MSVLAGALSAALLGFSAEEAAAAYTAKVKAGTLNVTGDAASDKLVLRLESGTPTRLQVDVGADGTADFSFDRGTFTTINVAAGRGNDEVRIDNSAGAFADEAVTLNGGADADTLLGGIGAETLVGGAGNDVVAGGDGNDRAVLGDGDDRFRWNPGDDNDVVDGQRGDDALDFNGAGIGEVINVLADAGHVRFTRDVANIVTDLEGVERIGFHAMGGADTIFVNDLTGTDAKAVQLDLSLFGAGDAQADSVVVRGTNGPDQVAVGSSNGTLAVSGLATRVEVGGSEVTLDAVAVATLDGADTVTTGVGTYGPASVNVEGGHDADTVRYSGTAGADAIAVVANGAAASVVEAASARLDAIAVESLVVLGLAGADTITATGNLAALTALTFDGGDDGDTLRGGNGIDQLLGGNGNDDVDGNQGNDQALLGDGDDRFQWDPGDGNDTVEGQSGNDLLDFNGSSIGETIAVSANAGRVRFTRDVAAITTDLDDVERIAFHAFGGADSVVVDDLTGTDAQIVDVDLNLFGGGGDAQADSVTARGTGGADNIGVGGSDGRIVVGGVGAQTRVAGGEAIDDVNVATLAGDDTITAAVGVPGPATVNVDGGEAADTVRYDGTAGPDTIAVVANGTEVSVVEAASARLDAIAVESLVVLGLAGADTITATGNLAALTSLTFDGGDDGDTLLGGNGPDLLLGGNGNDEVDGNQGNDRALLGDGDDRFQWDPGDGSDTVEGEGGTDQLDVFGSNIGEAIDISANSGRVRFTRNIGTVALDLDDIDAVRFRASGGSDTIVVNDLTGTDTTTVDIDLNAGIGGGDAQPDTVITNGTGGPDVVAVTRSGAQVLATGLAAQTRIVGGEAAIDSFRIQTLDGDDDVTVAPDVNELITPVVDLGGGE